jgi:hypothetical protein
MDQAQVSEAGTEHQQAQTGCTFCSKNRQWWWWAAVVVEQLFTKDLLAGQVSQLATLHWISKMSMVRQGRM